jgi:glycosyltransferase involved in cell wall biosynthesis
MGVIRGLIMKKVLLKGPMLTQSGYGHHARTVLRSLRSREDLFDIYLQAINWGNTSWLWIDNDERRWIDEKLQKTIEYTREGGQFDISLQVTIPNEWEGLAPVNIGITAGIETDRVSPKWIEKASVVDKIITISEHSKNTYMGTVYDAVSPDGQSAEFRVPESTAIEVVHYPARTFEPADIELDLKTDFNFLSVVQLSPRKNTSQLLQAFISEFKDNKNVGLILKLNMAKNSKIDRVHTLNRLRQEIEGLEEHECKFYLLHGYLTDQEMSALYQHPKVKSYVTSTHGEGFGLPIFEAACYGLPIIAPDWSGHLDFLYQEKAVKGKKKLKPMFSKVSFNLQQVEEAAVWDSIIQEDSQWAYPELGSLKMSMSDMYKDHGRFKKRATQHQKWVCEHFNEKKQNKLMVETIFDENDDQSWLTKIEDIVKEYE